LCGSIDAITFELFRSEELKMALENYFKHFQDVLTGRDERDPWPKKEDLQPGKIYIDQKSCSDVQSLLDEHRYCLVEGAERRGKTTLVRFIGLGYVEDWHVYRLDVSRVSDTSDLDDFVHLLEEGFLDRSDTLVIVEDCHMKPEVTKKLLKTVEGCQDARFLFTMRTVTQTGNVPVEEPFEDSEIRAQGWVVRLDETKEVIYNNIKGIVEKFLEVRLSSRKHKSAEAIPTSDDYYYLVQQTGGNKRVLNYYLEAWLNAESPYLSLRQVDKKLILEQFQKERLEALTEVQLEVVLIMSALGQFEVPIVIKPLFPSSVSKLDFDRAADELNTHLRGLAFRLPRGVWLFADTESRLTLECMEYQKRVDNRFVYEILSTYVKEAANYFEIFQALHRAQERPMLVLLSENAEVRNSLVRRFGDPNTILNEILYVLRAIAWADKTKALELWREYRKAFGEKFFDQVQCKLSDTDDIDITMSLLRFLETISREGEAVPLANALPAEFFVRKLRVEATSFGSFTNKINKLGSLTPEKAKQVLKCLDESDYRRFGEEARRYSLHSMMWFLRLLADDEKLKAFADHFLNAVGKNELTTMAVASSVRTIKNFRYYLRAVGTDMAEEILKSLKLHISDDEWTEPWVKETVARQSRRLWRRARSLNPDMRERGRRLARRLANPDVALHFGEAERVTLVEKLGWLLFSAYFLEQETAKGLALKAVQVFDAVSMAYSLEHLVFLLKNSRQCNPDVAQQLVEKIFSIDATSLLSKGDLDWFCQLLWLLVLSNERRTKKWVNEVSETFWEDLVVNTSRSNAFHLLMILCQINEELGRRVTHAVAQRLLTSPKLMDDSQAMALLGLLAFCDLKRQVAFSFSPTEKVTELCIYPTTQRLAFSLLYLQESKPAVIPGFIKACLTTGVTAIGIALLLAEYPLPWTASTMEKILVSHKSESSIQQEDVYDRMILLFKTIQSRHIYLNALLNKMCAPQFAPQHQLTTESEGSIERNEQKTRSWATIRLGKAIDKGIFIIQDIEHPITHTASRLLDLDLGHPEVAFALNITKDLVIALSNTQKLKGWTDINTWDTEFVGNWKGEPLTQRRIRYWQGILIRMNMAKVDYTETDRGDWAISFFINTDHPLVKSFIN
jgi:hypothetical protein